MKVSEAVEKLVKPDIDWLVRYSRNDVITYLFSNDDVR